MDEEDMSPEEDQSGEVDTQVAPTPPLALAGQGPTVFPQPGPQPGLVPLTPQQASAREQWRRLQYQTQGMPLDQTEAAVSAALRFQGQRQYQMDVANGMAPSEAMAKSAPLIFMAQKQSSLGQAASFINATAPKEFRPMDVGGTLYDVSDPKHPRAMTPTRQHQNQFDLAEYHGLLAQLREVQKNSADDVIGTPEFDAHQSQLRVLNSQLKSVRQRTPLLPSTPSIPSIAAAPAAPRLPVLGKNLTRVIGPGNKRGWVPAGTSLPKGWTIAQ